MTFFFCLTLLLSAEGDRPTTRIIEISPANASQTHTVWIATDKLTSFDFFEPVSEARCVINGKDKAVIRRGDNELHLNDLVIKAGEQGALSVRLKSGKKLVFALKGSKFDDADFWIKLVEKK